jgi:hypothetical protein
VSSKIEGGVGRFIISGDRSRLYRLMALFCGVDVTGAVVNSSLKYLQKLIKLAFMRRLTHVRKKKRKKREKKNDLTLSNLYSHFFFFYCSTCTPTTSTTAPTTPPTGWAASGTHKTIKQGSPPRSYSLPSFSNPFQPSQLAAPRTRGSLRR